jgi:hypothetical protein
MENKIIAYALSFISLIYHKISEWLLEIASVWQLRYIREEAHGNYLKLYVNFTIQKMNVGVRENVVESGYSRPQGWVTP